MSRWNLKNNGIMWNVMEDCALPHFDHIEMSGQGISVWVNFGAGEDKRLQLSGSTVFPTLRKIPNNTEASLVVPWAEDFVGCPSVNGCPKEEILESITFDGFLTLNTAVGEIKLKRKIFPARKSRALMQSIEAVNSGNTAVSLDFGPASATQEFRGCEGIYLVDTVWSSRTLKLEAGGNGELQVCLAGRKCMEQPDIPRVETELRKRTEFYNSLQQNLQLVTPDPVINQAFRFAKLHACENVFRTKAGLLHSPGGLVFYAAIWANDQIEYAGPLAPYLGDEGFMDAAINAYRLYFPFMGPSYHKIPCSIIAEGQDIWEGAGDRGDAAMYVYGASNFALASGSRDLAEELYPAIQWAIEYCHRQKNAEGVIASDSDELEGRFPAGEANLSTSCLYFGGLKAASRLAGELGKPEEAECYAKRAEELHQAINRYFAANVEGFDTYQYYKGNDLLRSWICLPLVMGITERKDETIRALLSDLLWTENGLLTQSHTEVFWDRSTLYGMRGILSVETNDQVMHYLRQYTYSRTLGEHVPYAVESYPAGNQRQLSGESALYCQIFTEGMLGLRPEGLHKFSLRPNIPTEWPRVELRNIRAYGRIFDILVEQAGDHYRITLRTNGEDRVIEQPRGRRLTVEL